MSDSYFHGFLCINFWLSMRRDVGGVCCNSGLCFPSEAYSSWCLQDISAMSSTMILFSTSSKVKIAVNFYEISTHQFNFHWSARRLSLPAFPTAPLWREIFDIFLWHNMWQKVKVVRHLLYVITFLGWKFQKLRRSFMKWCR